MQTSAFKPAPSTKFRTRDARAWAVAIRESGALLSAILKIAHPGLYRAGRESLIAMSESPAISAALATWPAVFNSVQIISNRETPFHRDNTGEATWLDLLMTLGDYGEATIVLRNLGVQVAYTPGTVVLLSGYLVHHGVANVPPDRICYSWFMTHATHANHGVEEVSWMNANDVY